MLRKRPQRKHTVKASAAPLQRSRSASASSGACSWCVHFSPDGRYCSVISAAAGGYLVDCHSGATVGIARPVHIDTGPPGASPRAGQHAAGALTGISSIAWLHAAQALVLWHDGSAAVADVSAARERGGTANVVQLSWHAASGAQADFLPFASSDSAAHGMSGSRVKPVVAGGYLGQPVLLEPEWMDAAATEQVCCLRFGPVAQLHHSSEHPKDQHGVVMCHNCTYATLHSVAGCPICRAQARQHAQVRHESRRRSHVAHHWLALVARRSFHTTTAPRNCPSCGHTANTSSNTESAADRSGRQATCRRSVAARLGSE